MSEPISGTPEVGGESDPVGDVHGIVDGDQTEPFAPASEGSDAGAEPDAPDTVQPESVPVDPGVSPEMISALNATTIPENLAAHWDHDGALRLYSEALAEGIAPEVLSKLMNSYSKGQSERLPGLMEAAQEQADAQMDEATAAHAAQSRRALQHEWKDGFASKVKTARDVAANLFGHDELQRLVQTELKGGGKLGDLPAFVKALHKMGGHMALKSSAELAQQDLAELDMDDNYNKHLWDQSDTPGRRAALEKRQQLFERAYPEEAPAQVESVTVEEQTAARAGLKAYNENKTLGAELSKTLSSLDDPRDRSDKNRQVMARWSELNRIANAPVASRSADGRFAGKPIGESANQMSREQALSEIATLEKDSTLWKEPTVGAGVEVHRALIKRRDALYRIAYD